MKNLFLWFLAAMSSVTLAQNTTYGSILDGEKVWTFKVVGSGLYKTVSYEEYKLTDGSSVDGVPYKTPCWRYRSEKEPDWCEWKMRSGESVGQDSQGKVYFCESYGLAAERHVTMDFSLQAGDVFRYESYEYIVTVVSDTLFENAADRRPRKCIHLNRYFEGEVLSGEFHEDVWIEGIGSLKFGLMGMGWAGYVGGSCQLYRCTQQGKVIYQCDEATSVQEVMHQ